MRPLLKYFIYFFTVVIANSAAHASPEYDEPPIRAEYSKIPIQWVKKYYEISYEKTVPDTITVDSLLLSLRGEDGPKNGHELALQICNDIIPKNIINELIDKLESDYKLYAGVNKPMSGIGMLGAHFVNGDCLPHRRELGLILISHSMLAVVHHMYRTRLLDVIDVFPTNPHLVLTHTFTQLTGLEPSGIFNYWSMQLDRLGYASPVRLVEEAKRLYDGRRYSLRTGYIFQANPTYAHIWITEALNKNYDLDFVRENLYWLQNNPAPPPDYRIINRPYLSGMSLTEYNQFILNDIADMGNKHALSFMHCILQHSQEPHDLRAMYVMQKALEKNHMPFDAALLDDLRKKLTQEERADIDKRIVEDMYGIKISTLRLPEICNRKN